MSSLRRLRRYQTECITLVSPIPCPVTPSSGPTVPLPDPDPIPDPTGPLYSDDQSFFAGSGGTGSATLGQHCSSIRVGGAVDNFDCASIEGIWYYY